METRLHMMKAVVKRTASIAGLIVVTILSGCEITEIGQIDWLGPYKMPGNNYVTPIALSPGFVSADSIVTAADDSLTLYGKFTPYVMNRSITMVEFGFQLTSTYATQKLPVRTNQVWTFPTLDTTVSISARIHVPRPPAGADFQVYFVFRNEYGIETEFQSNTITIRKFEPAFIAQPDSVILTGTGHAVLHGHLEAKVACEVTSANIMWGTVFDVLNTKNIEFTPSHLKPTQVIQICDTLPVLPNTSYQWGISATAKFANDSIATAPLITYTFNSGN